MRPSQRSLYLNETLESLVHGLSPAFLKHGLPRTLAQRQRQRWPASPRSTIFPNHR